MLCGGFGCVNSPGTGRDRGDGGGVRWLHRDTGTPGDGYGHINLQFNYNVPACTNGYLPSKYWRPGTDVSDTDPYNAAHCASGAPYNMRGTARAPQPSSVIGDRNRVAPYDEAAGQGGDGLTTGRNTVFGDNSWQWMLLGPTETP